MVKVLNQYFPGRVILLIFAENALIVLGVWVAVSLYLGLFSFALFYDPALWSRALLISLSTRLASTLTTSTSLKSCRGQKP